ncbi:MAG: hypothetical protein PHV97_05430 [Candidatus Omnitrophica bacterium]|nr:hypothetical protein [Candidatus Omnitrophota bacterium]
MATYKEVQSYVKKKYGIYVRTCWIADIKEQENFVVKRAWNRRPGKGRGNPCPLDQKNFIKEALRSA